MKAAIIIVDMQKDFVEGGALACAGGLALVPIINQVMAELGSDALVVTSQDWHELDSKHFEKWPVHCVAESLGAQLVDGLNIPATTSVQILKGTSMADDGYSAFEGRVFEDGVAYGTLDEVLRLAQVATVYVCGIATDYCVKATALEAKQLGYDTYLITNACVGVSDPTTREALAEMKQAGVNFMRVE